MCAPKTDGQRVIVLVENGVAHFFNRSFEPVLTGVVDGEPCKCSVLDGELIRAKEDSASVLVVHDAFTVEGISVTNIRFSLRMQMAQRLCERLRHKLVSTVYVVCKRFLEATCTNIKDTLAPTFIIEADKKPFRTLQADGVVFVDDSQPAHNQKDDVVIKWKDAGECTLDLRVGEDGLTLYLHHNDSLFSAGRATTRCQPGVIGEFNMRPNGEWQLIRHRKDRSRPNSAASAIQTLSFKSASQILWQQLIS